MDYDHIKRDPGYVSQIGAKPGEIDMIKSSAMAREFDKLSLYAHYVWYCRDNGLQARSKNTFSSAVLDQCNQVLGWREVQKTVNQANSRVIVGISLKGVHLEVRGVQRQEGSSEFEALLLYIMSD